MTKPGTLLTRTRYVGNKNIHAEIAIYDVPIYLMEKIDKEITSYLEHLDEFVHSHLQDQGVLKEENNNAEVV